MDLVLLHWMTQSHLLPLFCCFVLEYIPFKKTYIGKPCFLYIRLPAFMDLYIHPLYVLVSKILSSILNSPAPIHPLYHPLFTLSMCDLVLKDLLRRI
jgi:hypothetical protein